MNFDKLFAKIQVDLDRNSDNKYREKIRDYFKMDVENYLGVRLPLVRKIANNHFKEIRHLDIDDILHVCNQLLLTRIYEHKVIAFHWSYKYKSQFQKKHFKVFENWLKTYVNDWSDCDDLCTHTFGYFIFTFPDYISKVKTWRVSKNRWLTRASAVILIYSAKRGEHLSEIFETASSLLQDQDDLVQKGYGWMLKETSKAFQKEVFEYVMDNKTNMPRTALRYAIEKMPAQYKKQAMKK